MTESLGFWNLPIVRNSKYYKTQRSTNWVGSRPQRIIVPFCVRTGTKFHCTFSRYIWTHSDVG
jgi:hypothetical protein